MTISDFIKKLREHPSEIRFQDTMTVIDANYNFEPTAFINGSQHNSVGENSGSCKLLSFAKLHKLSENETLSCFGEYYRDVMKTPEGSDHQNIRNYIKTGWNGVSFDQQAIKKTNLS